MEEKQGDKVCDFNDVCVSSESKWKCGDDERN